MSSKPVWPKRVGPALGLVAFAVLIAQTCRKALREHGNDFTCYLDSGTAALAGTSPYDPNAYFEFLYSPFFALLMAPMTGLPVVVSAALWGTFSAFALVFAVRWIRTRTLGGVHAFDRRDAIALGLLVAIGFRIVHTNFANGQVNLIMVGMAVAFLRSLQRGQERSAGFWLALAVQVKTVPILLAGMLVLRCRWRALAWTAAFGVAMSLLPVLAWGGDTVAIYEDWFAMIDYKLRTYTVDMGAFTTDQEGRREYFTLRGMLATVWPATSPHAIAKYGCMATVLGATLLCDRMLRARHAIHASTAALSLWLLAALLTSPMSEKHHLAMLLPAAAFGLYGSLEGEGRHRKQSYGWAAAIFALVFLGKPMPEGPFYFLAILTAYAWVMRTAYLPKLPIERRESPL